MGPEPEELRERATRAAAAFRELYLRDFIRRCASCGSEIQEGEPVYKHEPTGDQAHVTCPGWPRPTWWPQQEAAARIRPNERRYTSQRRS